MKVIAVDDKVVVKQLNKSQTKGGLYIPDTVKTEPQIYGKVVSCGENVQNLNPGDIVMFHQKGGMAVVLEKTLYLVVKYSEVYAKIQDAELESQLSEVKIGSEE